jgi:hypothetical protein
MGLERREQRWKWSRHRGVQESKAIEWSRPVQIQHVGQEGLVLNNNDAEEFRIGSNDSALLGESEALSEKTTRV